MLLIAPARGFPWSRAWLLALRRPLAEEAEEGLRRAGERRNARSPPPPPSIPPPSPPPRLPLLPRMRLSRPRAGPPIAVSLPWALWAERRLLLWSSLARLRAATSPPLRSGCCC